MPLELLRARLKTNRYCLGFSGPTHISLPGSMSDSFLLSSINTKALAQICETFPKQRESHCKLIFWTSVVLIIFESAPLKGETLTAQLPLKSFGGSFTLYMFTSEPFLKHPLPGFTITSKSLVLLITCYYFKINILYSLQ